MTMAAELNKINNEKQLWEAQLTEQSSAKEKAEKDADDLRAKAQTAETEKEQNVAGLAEARTEIDTLKQAQLQVS
jgi:hypothetical protein